VGLLVDEIFSANMLDYTIMETNCGHTG